MGVGEIGICGLLDMLRILIVNRSKIYGSRSDGVELAIQFSQRPRFD